MLAAADAMLKPREAMKTYALNQCSTYLGRRRGGQPLLRGGGALGACQDDPERQAPAVRDRGGAAAGCILAQPFVPTAARGLLDYWQFQ